MKDRNQALVGAAVVAATVGLARWLSGRERLENQRLLLVGDGVGQALAAPLAGLAQAAQVPFDVTVQPGTRVEQWTRLRPFWERVRPGFVLAALGTADEAEPDVARQLAALADFREQVERRGARLFWVTPLRTARRDGFTAGLFTVLPARRIYDARRVIVQQTPEGIPTARGAVGLAGAVWRWLR